MSEKTVTTWTCERCGREVALPRSQRPEGWIKVLFSVLTEQQTLTPVGDLCDPCGGRLVSFVQGEDAEAVAQDRRLAAIIERTR